MSVHPPQRKQIRKETSEIPRQLTLAFSHEKKYIECEVYSKFFWFFIKFSLTFDARDQTWGGGKKINLF